MTGTRLSRYKHSLADNSQCRALLSLTQHILCMHGAGRPTSACFLVRHAGCLTTLTTAAAVNPSIYLPWYRPQPMLGMPHAVLTYSWPQSRHHCPRHRVTCGDHV
jgi:hypothetical protein